MLRFQVPSMSRIWGLRRSGTEIPVCRSAHDDGRAISQDNPATSLTIVAQTTVFAAVARRDQLSAFLVVEPCCFTEINRDKFMQQQLPRYLVFSASIVEVENPASPFSASVKPIYCSIAPLAPSTWSGIGVSTGTRRQVRSCAPCSSFSPRAWGLPMRPRRGRCRKPWTGWIKPSRCWRNGRTYAPSALMKRWARCASSCRTASGA